jgi:Protein of unknown function (DUF1552)
MVNNFAADFARVATLQFTNSVGGAKLRWLGIEEGHHELSHNRLLLSLAHGLGHRIERFGNPNFCGDGPLPGLT